MRESMQTLYYNGTILPMTGENVSADALLVRDGVIRAVGSQAYVEAAAKNAAPDRETLTVSLDGATLLPSFIDGHGHVSMAARTALEADLRGCGNFTDIIAVLTKFAIQSPSADVILGFGYDNNFLTEKCHPDKSVLDQVPTEKPILILNASAHMGVVNTAFIQAAGITSFTKDPSGGKIGRISGTSEPSGYLEESALKLTAPVLNRFKAYLPLSDGLKKIETEYLKHGITTVQDGAAEAADVSLMHDACEKNLFRADVVSYPIFGKGDPENFFSKYPESAEKYWHHFKLGGYKAVLDGSPQGKTAWLTTPYENSGDYRGYPWTPDSTAEKYVLEAIVNRRQILLMFVKAIF